MAIKAVIIDLDGTLLTTDKRVSERSERALMNIRDAGLPIIIATARPPRMVDDYFPITKKAEYTIYFNGALVRHRGKSFGPKYAIEHRELDEITRFMEARFPEAYMIYESDEDWFASRLLREEEIELYRRGQPDFCMPAIRSSEELEEMDVYKILFDKHGGVQETFSGQFGRQLQIGYMLGGNPVEVTSSLGSKEQAAAGILARLNIDPRDVAVFGDEYNDLGLFGLCGHPVAMGNAIDEIKGMAKRVTKTNDDHGVALVLEKILATGEV